jgi:DNA-directed RNA polymerase subunit RPC12/RpoP
VEHQEMDHIYLCPHCKADILHHIITKGHDLVGIVCSHCHTPSLVKKDELTYHQLKWEDELRQILSNLENPFDEP